MQEHEAQGSSQTKITTADAGQFKALVDLIRNDGFAMSFQSMRQYRQALIRVIENTAAPPAEHQPPADGSLTPVPDELFAAEFRAWWEQHGQFCRSGGGDYERTFAFEAWRHLYPQLMKLQKAAAEQQPCPEDIREGAPYDDPAFESLCREHEVWGTAAAAQCAVFWEGGKRAALAAHRQGGEP